MIIAKVMINLSTGWSVRKSCNHATISTPPSTLPAVPPPLLEAFSELFTSRLNIDKFWVNLYQITKFNLLFSFNTLISQEVSTKSFHITNSSYGHFSFSTWSSKLAYDCCSRKYWPVPVFGDERWFYPVHKISKTLRHIFLFLRRLHRDNIPL